jgi:hypothetical protein
MWLSATTTLWHIDAAIAGPFHTSKKPGQVSRTAGLRLYRPRIAKGETISYLGSDATRIWLASRYGISPKLALKGIVLDRIVAFVGLALLAAATAPSLAFWDYHAVPLLSLMAVVLVGAVSILLANNDIAISMDGKGAWRDNVFVERLWRSVKYEEVYLRAYDSVSEARASIGRYLDFYNRRRPHSSLDDATPDQAYFNPLPLRMAA